MIKVAYAIALLSVLALTFPIIDTEGTGPAVGGQDPIPVEGAVRIDVPDASWDEVPVGGTIWTISTMDGASSPPFTGAPALPAISHPLVLDHRLLDINLVRSDPKVMRLGAPVLPVIGSYPVGEVPAILELEPYDIDSVHPEEPLIWRYMGSSWEGGKEMHHYSVIASPFEYSPSTGRLVQYRTLEIVPVPDPMFLKSFTPPRGTEPPSSFIEGSELLIVTNNNFLDELEPYRQWKLRRGIMTTVVAFNTVDSEYPSLNDPQSLWQYVHDSYFFGGGGLKYLLLVGEKGSVPSLEVKDLNPFTGEPSTLPADTYFGCLGSAGSTPDIWNADGDADWGEVNDIQDHIAEVSVSRIALSSDQATSAWVDKVMDYEMDPPMDGWAGRAGLFGADTHDYFDGADQCDYLWSGYMNDEYSVKAPYYSQGHYGSTPLTYGNIRTGFYQGFGIVVYMGHGLRYLWSEGLQSEANYLFDTNEASSLSQGTKLPFITAMSCETNWFDGPSEAISEGFTENTGGGAIAYAGASRTTYGGIGYDTYLPGAPGIQQDIVRMISDDQEEKRASSEIFISAKNYYADAWGAYFSPYDSEPAFNCWMEHNLLGPAETPIWTSAPKELTVSYEYDQDYNSNFTVRVTGPGSVAVAGAVVTVYSPARDRLSIGIANGAGTAVVPFTIDEPQMAYLTISGQGYRPWTTEMYLSDTTDPVTSAVTAVPNPDGANGWFVTDPGLRLVRSEDGTSYYRWNNGVKTTYKGQIAVPIGENTLQYWSEDLSGNIEATRTRVIKYDPEAPVLSISVEPELPDGANGWYNTPPVFQVGLSGSEGSDQRIEYWWDRSSKEVAEGSISAIEGEHTLHIQGVDDAGNRGEELSFDLKVDSIVPVTSLYTGGVEPNERGWFVSPFTITLKSDDRSATTYYRWDDSAEWAVYKTELDPREGDHSLTYYSADPNGNAEGPIEAAMRYDLTPPVTSIVLDPPEPDGEGGHYITRPTLSLSSDEPGCCIMFSLGDGVFETYTSTLTLGDGTYKVKAYAFDEAGNQGGIADLDVKVDITADKVDFEVMGELDVSGWYLSSPVVQLTTGSGTSIFFSWSSDGEYQRYTGTLIPPVQEGIVQLSYYSLDKAGNKGQVIRQELPIDSLAPVASLTAPVGASPGEAVTFDMSGSIDGVGITGYWIDFGDGTVREWTAENMATHSYSGPGNYEVTMKARDAAGHVSDPVTVKLTVDGQEGNLLLVLIVAAGAVVLASMTALVVALAVHRSHHHHVPPHQHMVRTRPAGPMLPSPGPVRSMGPAPNPPAGPPRAPPAVRPAPKGPPGAMPQVPPPPSPPSFSGR